MSSFAGKIKQDWRIIFAIAGKDFLDVFKNKIILSIVIGVGFMMLSSFAMPLLSRFQSKPTAFVYDPNRLEMLAPLVSEEAYRFRTVRTREILEEVVAESTEPVLGIVFPDNFQPGQNAEETLQLEGFASHWMPDSELIPLTTLFEKEITGVVWQDVVIQMSQWRLYPEVPASGYPFMIANGLALITMVMGLSLVSNLLIGEKESRTLDVLTISPANFSHIVWGKFLVGFCFCSLAGALALGVNAKWIVHWDVAIFAVMMACALSVMLGLLLGGVADKMSSVNMWVGLFVLLLMLPIFVSGAKNVPPVLNTIIDAIPSVAMMRLTMYAMTDNASWSLIQSDVLIMSIGFLVVFGLVLWRLRRVSIR
jgi:ABC-type transport system involved in multi-copper enzyme maturation permease subunit